MATVDLVIYLLIAVSLIILLLLNGKQRFQMKLWNLLYEYTLKAELEYGSGKGMEKKKMVIQMLLTSPLYKKIPSPLKIFLNDTFLSNLIDDFIRLVFNMVKEHKRMDKED